MNDLFAEPAGIDAAPHRPFRTVMVTGHRPQHLTPAEQAWAQAALHTSAWRLRSRYGMVEGISGMALGADTWWALAVLATGARLAAYLPFEDQPVRWSAEEQSLWAELRRRAHREVVVGGRGYRVQDLHARNDAMLTDTAARGGLVVALLKPDAAGGTASVVQKARRAGRPLLLLDPAARTVTRDGW